MSTDETIYYVEIFLTTEVKNIMSNTWWNG
jgi:hypothetical protein